MAPALAFERSPELSLQQALPIDGMARGNLSALQYCGGELLAVSDREDQRLFMLQQTDAGWQAKEEYFELPDNSPSMLPVQLLAGAWLRGLSGRALDFEGLACDAKGNRYLVSESQVGVLQLPPAGDVPVRGKWLDLDPAVYSEGEAQGLWQQVNALAEGVAINAEADTLWLAAERQGRGLVKLQRQDDQWRCPLAGCVLLAERRFLPTDAFAPGVLNKEVLPVDFSDLALWQGKLWTLERNAHQVCRRSPLSGQRERCWSFAQSILSEPYIYPDAPYGLAEALLINEHGVMIGLDNNDRVRPDGDSRPWVFQFALPDDWQEDERRE
ncbi:esterase-like activity of phytase family protein [Halopseudomonas sp.]|uniref:esterase-like activity of phytase family protein n=1 Tax=Halopseudomonas sp. TaxID=2901191 RepID=UPI003001505B